MAKLDMDGPFDLNDSVIDQKIDAGLIGNFALGFMNGNGKFVVKAVGRSDSNLNKEVKSASRRYSGGLLAKIMGRPSRLKKFKFSIADTADSAYQVEKRAFENFGGEKKLMNKKPPSPPR
jgi:hypothetical protein